MKQSDIQEINAIIKAKLPKVGDLKKNEKKIVREISEIRLQIQALKGIQEKLQNKLIRKENDLFCSLYNRGIR